MRGRGGVHVRLTGCHVIRGSAADVIERTSMLADDVGPSHRRWEDQRTGSDTLHVETGSDVQAPEPTHVESTQGYSLASQRRSSRIHQVKDGDIRLRWTSLALASDGAALSAAANGQTWRAAHYLVSRLSFSSSLRQSDALDKH